MKTFDYLIKTNEGIHARPATLIVTNAKQFQSQITIKNKDKEVDGKRMIAIMSLNAKQGDILQVTISGEDEQLAFEKLFTLFKENI